jgi:FecR protein
MRRFAIRSAALTLLLTAAGAAQNPVISSLKGSVSVRNGDSGVGVAAAVHAPLQAGDYLTTGPNSRADIEFDSTDTFRMGGNAQIHFMPPESGKYQMELIKGDITYNAAGPAAPIVAVDTPSVSVRPAHLGVYRIAVNAARESEITVMEGEVEVFAPSGSQWIGAGQKMMARGSASDPEFKVVRAISKWRRAASVLLSSMQLGVNASSSSSEEERSYSKERSAPKPASKTTPIAAGNGNAKPTPARGSFAGASSGGSNASNYGPTASPGHAAAATSSHASSNSSTHTASTQAASTSSSHTAAAASSDHSSSSNSSRSR